MRSMTPSHPSLRLSLPGLVAASMLLTLAVPAAAAPGAVLEFYFGPNQTDWLSVESLQVQVDGQEVPVRLPALGDPPGTALHSGPIAPGPHLVQVAAVMRGASGLFTYVNDYRFTMHGRLDVNAPAGQVLGVHGRIQASSGMTTEWTDRYTLALAAAPFPSDRVPDVEPPRPVPPPPVITPRPPPAAACALAPVRFGFDKATLTPEARRALDGFATCVAPGASSLQVDGHCDVRGSAAYNMALGERRAAAVARYLERLGVAPGRISTSSFGKSRPLCGERTEACHARNRRVEIMVGE
jgi:outer membrane protein OmpA-like peptidoglycan-associated protein